MDIVGFFVATILTCRGGLKLVCDICVLWFVSMAFMFFALMTFTEVLVKADIIEFGLYYVSLYGHWTA